jgi:spoIIIJ-associated protein
MRSMQYLISMALKTKEFEITRVNVDIADYKKQRAHRLEDRASAWLKEVKDTGKEKHLQPMNSADRRTIHRLAGEHGLDTESEGEGRDRHIVLKPSGQESEEESKVEEISEEKTTEEPVEKSSQDEAKTSKE